MPSTIPTLDLNAATNYPPALAAALNGMYVQGLPFWLTFSVDFNTADAAVLFTVPTLPNGATRLNVAKVMLEVAVSFTGGSTPAIGVSSSNAAFNAAGDLLGGSGGMLTAALTAGWRGADGTKARQIVLVAGDTIRWNLIASQFTAGSGKLHCHCNLLPVS